MQQPPEGPDMPSLKDLEEYIDTLETYVVAQITRLTDDLRRFGPPEMPQLPLPDIASLPVFASIPPPPPAPPLPPPPRPLMCRMGEWAVKHRPVLIGAGTVAGLGLVAGGWLYWSSKRINTVRSKVKAPANKEVVVVLGADSALGHLLVGELCSSGYIVVASVATPEAIPELDRLGKGYVKALVLDPADATSATPFFRSLQSTLSLKFPIAPGDPYAPSSSLDVPLLVSVISLLSLHQPTSITTPASPSSSRTLPSVIPSQGGLPRCGISELSIAKDYLPHLISAHLTPLNVIQSLLPLIRVSKKRGIEQPSIIVALPGGPEAVGIVGYDPSTAMTNAAMAKGCDILRREVTTTPSLSGTRVVVVDVGELSVYPRSVRRSLRKPTDAHHFTSAVARIVKGIQRTHSETHHRTFISSYFSWVGLMLQDWWRGDRFSVGAGAGSYALAAYLPPRVLDALLFLPQQLIQYHDWVQTKARHLGREVQRERRRRKEKERLERMQAEEGQQVVIVPKPPRSMKSDTASASGQEKDGDSNSDSTPSDIPDSASEPESEPGVAREDDTVHEERVVTSAIGESWVMDVEQNGAAPSQHPDS
ncbi:hypothetical protein FRB99_001620 [Tulasnella sp. 403]|nr:hypothetical protein FRB99_001620 [Tulasnella sp. 403]